MPTIVVGVDGSAGAHAATVFALEEARLRGARLRLVAAWHVPVAVYGSGFAGSGFAPPVVLGDGLSEAADSAIRETLERLGKHDEVEVETEIRRGQPAEVLVEQSADASCWSSARAGSAGSAACCSARSAINARITRTA
ncbi:MAG TPA: universal stress protein, partial [Gaiellaceae bacterium]|nr:universal stress protein [Gaiellaceae bacterium]